MSGKTDADYGKAFLDLQDALDIGWLLCFAPIVLFMHCGLNLFESGSVRVKNTKYILLKNTLATCIAGLGFWLIGTGFAFGRKDGSSNGFIGNWSFALSDFKEGKAFYFFQSMICGVSTIVATASVAERVHMHVYAVWQSFYVIWTYPVVAHWLWSPDGWLKKMGNQGAIDYAGVGVMHLLAGVSGLAAALLVGPRLGRYSKKGRLKTIEGHSATWVAMGTFISWFGWFGLNIGGALQCFSREGYKYAGLVAVNTVVAPAASALTILFYNFFKTQVFDLNKFLRGIFVGLVSISGAAATVEVWAALVIGVVAPFLYLFTQTWMTHPRIRIDDPTHFSSVFFCGGIWGMVATALFSTQSKTSILLQKEAVDWGLFYGGGGMLLGINVLAVVVIIGWGFFWTLVPLLPFKLTHSIRVSKEVEQKVLEGKETANFARVEVMNNGPPEIFQFRIA